MIMRNRHMPYMPDEDEEKYSFFKKADASSFFTSGNYISMDNKVLGKRSSLILYHNLKDDNLKYDSDGFNLQIYSSTNGDLRSIVSTIRLRSGEMQWKLIPVIRQTNSIETLIGYVRCEAASHYLQKYFELIIGNISSNELWLNDPNELSMIIDEKLKSKIFVNLCSKNLFESHSQDWKSFLTEEINWEELIEEKPCSVTMTTKLSDIQVFVQRNFLPQVFVMDGMELSGVITRENIIEQIKLLHRQSGILAVSYRADLQSLPMRVIKPDQIMNLKFFPKFFNEKNCSVSYAKLRTHSE